MLLKVGLLLSLVSIVVAKSIVEPKPKHAFSSQHVHKHDGHHELVTHKEHGHVKHHDYYAHPKYEFEYKIEDDHTGDHKNHHETRDGDVVKGFYEFKDPDGTVRRVEYHADKHSGFHANVKHSTHHQHKKHKM